MLRLACIASALVVVVLLCGLAAGPQTASAAQCPGGDKTVRKTSERKAARATMCLLNKKRRAHGLSKLRNNKHQKRAANRHNRRMVRRGCFSHECPGEPGLVRRITRAGYLSCSCSYMIAENIAWGKGRKGTPRKIVEAWMHSPGHRANILNPRFEDIGVAVDRGSPGGHRHNAATYTTDFGYKH
jgi:uncharacterized protein YkwD